MIACETFDEEIKSIYKKESYKNFKIHIIVQGKFTIPNEYNVFDDIEQYKEYIRKIQVQSKGKINFFGATNSSDESIKEIVLFFNTIAKQNFNPFF